MALTVAFEVNAPDVVTEEFDSEFVVLDLSVGTYFSFQGSGNRIWRALAAGMPPAVLLGGLAAAGHPHLATVERFVSDLVEARLLRPAEGAPPLPFDPALAAPAEPPAIDRFDDLADLILADPIHEADAERGWPLRQE